MSIKLPAKIAFIGFGEAGQRFAETLKAHGATSISAYDIKQSTGEDDTIRAAATRLGVELANSAPEAADGADWIFSAVTADACGDAVASVAAALKTGQVYIDINSVSARVKQSASAQLPADAFYVDMAVMAPVMGKGHQTPTLVAGALDKGFIERLEKFAFDFEHVGDEVGMATTIKLTRSMFVKGLEAITVQALIAAKQSGCYDRILSSLSKSFSGLGWPDFAAYELERVARHGVRRGAEMHECALMMADNGFATGAALADAIAALQDEIGVLGHIPNENATLENQFENLLKARGANT